MYRASVRVFGNSSSSCRPFGIREGRVVPYSGIGGNGQCNFWLVMSASNLVADLYLPVNHPSS
ncbi:hypothetical protein C8R42DRAFT_676512 [Lentinula raphanica]|nr:hypothetical protein C8R42DRAFT_676512 [Lentinula raphanica]